MENPETITEESLEQNLDLHQVKQRSISGALAFVSRTVLLQGVGIVAFFLLSVLLTTAEVGIFIVVDATVSFLVYFSDVGLGAALIQKKKKLTRDDLATTFTIQQVLVVSLIALTLIFSRQIGNFYDYGPQASSLFLALVFSFFLSSLKTIPSILLERDLEFNKLVIPQIFENLAFYSLAVYFAWRGHGVASYTYAVIVRAIVGLVVIYILKPWKPIFGFNRKVAKSLTTFGAPFQLNSILALFKDRALIIFLGKVLAPAQVGYLGWAEKWALLPIRFFADPVLKVTFPAYSKLQDNKRELKKAIEKSIFFVGLLVFPAAAGIIALAPALVAHIPRYAKWQPALTPLLFYSINTLFSSISITLTNTLNATGKVKTTLKLMVMWTALTWIFTPTLINLFGYSGAAIASAITASSSIIAYYLVNKIVKIDLIGNTMPTIISASTMFVFVWYVAQHYATSLTSTLAIIPTGVLVYFIAIYLLAKDRLTSEFAIVRKYLKKK